MRRRAIPALIDRVEPRRPLASPPHRSVQAGFPHTAPTLSV
jgi:hypothetical protein